MASVKSRLFAVVGIVGGIVALRAVRNRRSKQSGSEPIAGDRADDATPTEHAAAAAKHGRLAVEKAVEATREEIEGAEESAATGRAETPGPVRRLRKRRKG